MEISVDETFRMHSLDGAKTEWRKLPPHPAGYRFRLGRMSSHHPKGLLWLQLEKVHFQDIDNLENTNDTNSFELVLLNPVSGEVVTPGLSMPLAIESLSWGQEAKRAVLTDGDYIRVFSVEQTPSLLMDLHWHWQSAQLSSDQKFIICTRSFEMGIIPLDPLDWFENLINPPPIPNEITEIFGLQQ